MADGSRTDHGPSYCSNCGTSLDATSNYCSQCGSKVKSTTPAGDRATRDESDDADDDYRAFRRRVQDRLLDGWEVESDTGDSVVLVDRGLGTFGWHVLVFLTTVWWTGGLGNLCYAGYKYFVDTDRLVLRAGGTAAQGQGDVPDVEQAPRAAGDSRATGETPGSAAATFLLGLVGVLLVAWTWFDPANLAVGLVFLLGAVYAFPPFRRRLADRHPVTAFGRTKTTDERVVSDPSRPCSICYGPVEEGIERTYREDVAVAGFPLYTVERGDNCYCRACASGQSADDAAADGSADETKERFEYVTDPE